MNTAMASNMTNDEIKTIIEKHEKMKEYRRVYYNNKYHTDSEYKSKQIEYGKKNSKTYYQNNKDKVKQRRIFRYYNERGRLDDMYKKYPQYKPEHYIFSNTINP
jgi:hypothetical protein